MRTLIALNLLLAAVAASPGYGDHQPHGGYGSYFSQKDLADAEDFLHRINAERSALLDKVNMLKAQQGSLLVQLDILDNTTLPSLQSTQTSQESSLESARSEIQNLWQTVDSQEAQMAGEGAMASSNEDEVTSMWNRIQDMVESNHRQQGLLDGANVVLGEATQKLNDKLQGQTQTASGKVDDVISSVKAFTNLVNTRHCTVLTGHVDIDPQTGQGQQNVSFNGTDFNGNTPPVYCAVQGFVTELDFDNSHGYGYGNYPDLHQNLALTVDCKAFPDFIQITAVDLSRGKKNSVVGTYVQAKACSFGPQPSV